MEKHLAIATWDADSVELYAQQVRNFLGEHIQISTYSVQGGTIDQIAPADVYLISTCALIGREISHTIPNSGAVVITEVRITRESLHRLMAMPRGTNALLVCSRVSLLKLTA